VKANLDKLEASAKRTWPALYLLYNSKTERFNGNAVLLSQR
jgi:hypothetical protein